MVATCAFYGFLNRTTKVKLQVDLEKLEVGGIFPYEGENYIILSLFESEGTYHANVTLEHIHRARTLSRAKGSHPSVSAFTQHDGRSDVQESTLDARLKAAEAKIQLLMSERDEMLRRLDHAIQQLDRLHRNEGT